MEVVPGGTMVDVMRLIIDQKIRKKSWLQKLQILLLKKSIDRRNG